MPVEPKTSDVKCQRVMLDVLAGRPAPIPPVWLMRQAGRYLPEYRATREKAGGFLNLCYTPALAAEVTLQPIRRYGFDAAILFSDILVVPDALGQSVGFNEGEGPRLDPIRDVAGLSRLDFAKTGEKFSLVYETVARLRSDLPPETTLIGFCGAPWTVATYMVGGKGSSDQAEARLFAYGDPDGFRRLIDILVEASVTYLSGQVKAGADCLQIFDTWAGTLPDDQLRLWVFEPTQRIVSALKDRHPGIPIIGFARGIGPQSADYVRATGIDGVGCDTAMPPRMMRDLFQNGSVAVQGNLDPLLLVSGGAAMEERARHIVETMRGMPFIFNLGHGIVPQTPPDNVARLLEVVRGR